MSSSNLYSNKYKKTGLGFFSKFTQEINAQSGGSRSEWHKTVCSLSWTSDLSISPQSCCCRATEEEEKEEEERRRKKKKNLTQLGTKPRSRAVSRIRLRRKSSQIWLEMIQRCQEVSGGQLHNGMRLFIYLFTLGQTDLLTVHYTSCRAETLCLAEAANTDSPLIR